MNWSTVMVGAGAGVLRVTISPAATGRRAGSVGMPYGIRARTLRITRRLLRGWAKGVPTRAARNRVSLG